MVFRDGSKILEVRSHSRVEKMSVLDPSDITTDRPIVDVLFGESHEAHEISVDEEKNLEIDDALKVFGANWSSGRNRGFVWINLCLPRRMS